MDEIKQFLSLVTLEKSKGKIYNRDEVFDKMLQQRRLRLIEELRQCPSGLCEVLKKSIKYGIAYHHSGLTIDEKCIIEKGVRMGILFVLVATSTLSTGINLPVKAVIFRTPFSAS